MARLLSQALIRHATATTRISFALPTTTAAAAAAPTSLTFLHHRHGSSQSGKGQLIEIELDSSSDGEIEEVSTTSGVRKLEDLIHRIIVLRSAPNWLPFIPGSSYWVPPNKKPSNVVELIGKLANPLTDEEAMSLTTVRGWPSSSYFLDGGESTGPVEVNVEGSSTVSTEVDVKGSSTASTEVDVKGSSTASTEVDVEVRVPQQADSGNKSKSEDEEG